MLERVIQLSVFFNVFFTSPNLNFICVLSRFILFHCFNHDTTSERKKMLQKLIKNKNKAIERATKQKEERAIHIREKNLAELNRIMPRKEMIAQNEIK